MVNKLAVIAIVAILAVPILIGFGMNLEPTTKTEYLADKDPVNVTQLLQNGTTPGFVHADTYTLNGNVKGFDGVKVIPHYIRTSTNYSGLKASFTTTYPTGTYSVTGYDLMSIQLEYDYSGGNFYTLQIVQDTGGGNVTINIPEIRTFYWSKTDGYILHCTRYNGAPSVDYSDVLTWHLFKVGNPTNLKYTQWFDRSALTNYVDMSAGFTCDTGPADLWSVGLPNSTKMAVMTVNLDSMTDPNPSFDISIPGSGNHLTLQKRTVNGVVSWVAKKGTSINVPLYYDSSRSDNTYQIVFSIIKTGTDTRVRYDLNYELRYVGGWPTLIGQANYYQNYKVTFAMSRALTDPEAYLGQINVGYSTSTDGRTAVIRMDDALYAGMDIAVIKDNTYTPGDFKTNPATSLKNIDMYGSAIEFAGNSYTVDSSGNITMGTHSVSLNGIVFDSVPVAGGYDNRINGTTISTTAQPSTIKFVGQWIVNVSTDSQSTNTYQTTVWHAGQFAWDGMDQNFLIVGLITSLGAFLGLGIYARKSNSKGVIPLMIVCGCAATLFFIML